MEGEESRVILVFSGKCPSLKRHIRGKVLLTRKFNFRHVDFEVLGEYPWRMAMSIRQLGEHGQKLRRETQEGEPA